MKKDDAKKSAKIEEQDKQIALLKWKLKELEDNWEQMVNDNEELKNSNTLLQQKFTEQQDEITRWAGSVKTLAGMNQDQETETKFWQLHAEETEKQLKAEEVTKKKLIRDNKMGKNGSKDRKVPKMDKEVQTESAIYFYEQIRRRWCDI